MITVSILINGRPLFARSAKRHDKKNEQGENLYVTDSGAAIFHDYEDSAIELAKKCWIRLMRVWTIYKIKKFERVW
jgi:hypothetical protein